MLGHSCAKANETRDAISHHLQALQEPSTNLGKRKRDLISWRDNIWSAFVDKSPFIALPSKLQAAVPDEQWTEILIEWLDGISKK